MVIIYVILNVFKVALIIRVLLSFIPIQKENPTFEKIYNIIYSITEPVLAPVRKFLFKYLKDSNMMRIDLSPLVVFILIFLLESFIR
jgi:uncharacterized protein YggT (Ycf19 family)